MKKRFTPAQYQELAHLLAPFLAEGDVDGAEAMRRRYAEHVNSELSRMILDAQSTITALGKRNIK